MADFFLSSSDSSELNALPRACTRVGVVRMSNGAAGVVVDLDPPLVGEMYKSEKESISRVVLVVRFGNGNIERPEEWPIYVYVLDPTIDDVASRTELREGEYEIAAWGDVFATVAAARAIAFDTDDGDSATINR